MYSTHVDSWVFVPFSYLPYSGVIEGRIDVKYIICPMSLCLSRTETFKFPKIVQLAGTPIEKVCKKRKEKRGKREIFVLVCNC